MGVRAAGPHPHTGLGSTARLAVAYLEGQDLHLPPRDGAAWLPGGAEVVEDPGAALDGGADSQETRAGGPGEAAPPPHLSAPDEDQGQVGWGKAVRRLAEDPLQGLPVGALDVGEQVGDLLGGPDHSLVVAVFEGLAGPEDGAGHQAAGHPQGLVPRASSLLAVGASEEAEGLRHLALAQEPPGFLGPGAGALGLGAGLLLGPQAAHPLVGFQLLESAGHLPGLGLQGLDPGGYLPLKS